MRKITVCTFLDGVIQSPGSPEEDTKSDFKWGGWSAHFWDEVMNQTMAKTTSQPYYAPDGAVKTGQMSLLNSSSALPA